MTQSGQVTLFDWPETTLGVIPSGPAPTGRRVRFTSENLLVAPVLADSPEIAAGNEPEDQTQNGFEGGGDIGVAFSPRNYDEWLASLMWNTWAAPGGGNTPVRTTGSAQVTYDPATRTLTTSGTWTNTPAAGDKILVWNSSNAYLNGIHTVDPTSTPTATTIVLEEDGILSDAVQIPAITTPQNITIMRGDRLTNSLTPTRQSRGFEKRIQRVIGKFLGVTATSGAPTTDYSVFLAMLPTRMQMQGTGDTPLTGQFSWEASREIDTSQAASGATVMAGTTEPDATPIFQGISCVKKCRVYVPAMSAVAGNPGKIQDTLRMCPQSFSLELANGMQTTPLMCAQPEKDYQYGEPLAQFQVTGIYDSPFSRVAFNQQLDCVFEFAIVAANGEGYLFRLPRAKVQASRNDTTGRRTTVQGQMTIKAFKQTSAPVAGDSARAVEIYRFRQS